MLYPLSYEGVTVGSGVVYETAANDEIARHWQPLEAAGVWP